MKTMTQYVEESYAKEVSISCLQECGVIS